MESMVSNLLRQASTLNVKEHAELVLAEIDGIEDVERLKWIENRLKLRIREVQGKPRRPISAAKTQKKIKILQLKLAARGIDPLVRPPPKVKEEPKVKVEPKEEEAEDIKPNVLAIKIKQEK